MTITRKDVEHMAALSRVKLTQKEKEKLLKDLGSILDYVEKLKEVHTKNVEATAQVTGFFNIFRKDDKPIILEGEEIQKMVNQSPQKKDDYIKVKAVLK